LTLLHLRLEGLTTDVLALSKSDVEGLGADHLAVHLLDGLGGLIGGRVANETEVARSSVLVLHDLAGSDSSKGVELSSETLVIPLIVKVLDVKVDTGRLGLVLHALLLVGSAEFVITLGPLLGTTDVKLLSLPLLVVELIGSLLGRLVRDKVDETETLGGTVFLLGKGGRDNVAVSLEQVLELLLGSLEVNVLDEDVGELSTLLLDLGLTLLLSDVVADEDLLVVEQHTVDGGDSGVGGVTSRVVDEGESTGLSSLVGSDLAGENVTESGKGVVKSLVVNALVKVLDEDVSLAGLAEGGVTLGPHDSARAVLDKGVVEMLEGALTVGGVKVVDVGVSERTTGNGVTADSDAIINRCSRDPSHATHLATGPIKLKISKSMASVTVLSSSPT